MSQEKDHSKDKSKLLEKWLSGTKKQAEAAGIKKKPADSQAPLSHGQGRLFLLQQLYPENPFYNYAHLFQITGSLDVKRLVSALEKISERHHILNTYVQENEGIVTQCIQSAIKIPVTEIDLSHLDRMQQETEVHRLSQHWAQMPFDLSKGPLLRLLILHRTKETHSVILGLHHFAGDYWSLHLLKEEWALLYQNPTIDLPALPLQYADFAFWQLHKTLREEDINYWTKKLKGDLPILQLPSDHLRPLRPSFKGASVSGNISAELSLSIKELSKNRQSTLFVFLLTAFKVLLYRLTDQSDLLVGTPFSNRDRKELEKLIGFFNETLVLRSNLSGDPSFIDLVEQVKQTTLEAFAHSDMPFENLVRLIKPERNPNINPIFQVMFLYNEYLPAPSFGEYLQVEDSIVDVGTSKFDLTLFITDHGGYFSTSIEFSSDMFERNTIERIHDRLLVLLESIVKNPTESISRLNILPNREKHILLQEWTRPREISTPFYSIHEFFEKQALLHPHRKAVIYKNNSFNYKVLSERVSKLALVLAKFGVGFNHPVGLFVNRSLDMITGIWAILKAGGAYVPLDPEYPADRIDFILRDAGITAVLTQKELSDQLSAGPVRIMVIEEMMDQEVKDFRPAGLEPQPEDSLAYIIYTSGSTGRPKGVPIKHRNLIQSTLARFEYYQEHPGNFLLLSSFAFDSSVAGIFWTLCSGGTLVLPEKRAEQDMSGLAKLIAEQKITHTLLLPSLYNILLENTYDYDLSGLRIVMVAGEACTSNIAKKHFDRLAGTRLFNEYGPTEATVWCTVHEITPDDRHNVVPIGKPILVSGIFILDSHFSPVPIGMPGELYVGGFGVADGYWNRPELTNEKFFPNIFTDIPGAKLYKTGDLVRFRPNGLLEFLGRTDHQIKIRGYRVELEEIQEIILQLPEVTDVIMTVSKTEEGLQRLIAYVAGKPKPNPSDITSYVRSKLPGYMVPAWVHAMEEFPRLPNGKADVKALEYLVIPYENQNNTFVPARNELEKQLIALWQEVLGINFIGINDNFFDLGGDSIASIRIVSDARKIGLVVAPNHLFEYQTIAALSPHVQVSEKHKVGPDKKAVTETLGDLPLTYMQKAFLLHHLQSEKDQGFLQMEFYLSGPLEVKIFFAAWQKVVELHPILRTSIHWHEIEKPCQRIHPTATLPNFFHDWKKFTEEQQKEKLHHLKGLDKQQKLDLKEPVVSRLNLIALSDRHHCLLWSCHHILLDGWSGGIILKDALLYYDHLINGSKVLPGAVPSMAVYHAWRENLDLSKTMEFWRNHFSGISSTSLFSANDSNGLDSYDEFTDLNFNLSAATNSALMDYSGNRRITLPTFLQGLWGIVLCKYFGTNEIVVGTTFSGRFSDIKDIDRMTGLLMTVLPMRIKLLKEDYWSEWLKSMQIQQAEMSAFEHTTQDEILGWIGWPEHMELFDNLFIFGNFLKDGIQAGDISVTDFLGGFTSTYPLSIRVNPVTPLEFIIRYNSRFIDPQIISWLKNSYLQLIQFCLHNENTSLGVLYDQPATPPTLYKESKLHVEYQTQDEKFIPTFSAPRNTVELQLTRIWEKMLGKSPIGVHDNFFQLGGRSLFALRLLAQISKQWDVDLSPDSIIQHPTIAGLARLIHKGGNAEEWSCIVPIRAGGNLAPLFCIHAGGAHVFFYRNLAQCLHPNQPVYAIQPKGLDGHSPYHTSIEEMAIFYIQEIKKIQPQGPYSLLGTCFSNTVVLEMAGRLAHAGDKVGLMAIIDSGPAFLSPQSPHGEQKPLRRFLSMAIKGNWRGIQKKILSRFFGVYPTLENVAESWEDPRLLPMIKAMNKMYDNYIWRPYPGKITLIRSTEFHRRRDKKFHVQQWSKLAGEGLEVYVVPGHHLSLFEFPEVQGLAKQLTLCLNSEPD